MASSNNSKSSNNTRYPAIAMQQYLDTDIRRQCQKITQGNNKKVTQKLMPILSGWGGRDKTTGSRSNQSFPLNGAAYHRQSRLCGGFRDPGCNMFSRSSSMGMSANDRISESNIARARERSLSLNDHPGGKTSKRAAYHQQSRVGGGFRDPGCNLFPRSSSMGMSTSDRISESNSARSRQRSLSLNDHSRAKTKKYDGLTTAQKAEIVINDAMQWHKLQQSLREADGVWTHLGVQQVIDTHLQMRLEEMERLEEALREQNGLCRNAIPEHSAAVETIEIQEVVGVVGAVKKFARRASVATHNYLVNQKKNIETEQLESALNERNGPRHINLSEHSAVETKKDVGVVETIKKISRSYSLATHNDLLNQNKNCKEERLELAFRVQKNKAKPGVSNHSDATGSVETFIREASLATSTHWPNESRSGKMKLSESASGGQNGPKPNELTVGETNEEVEVVNTISRVSLATNLVNQDKNGKVEHLALSRQQNFMKHYDSIEHSTDVEIHEELGVVNNTTQIFMPDTAEHSADVETHEEVLVVGTTTQSCQPNDIAEHFPDDGN